MAVRDDQRYSAEMGRSWLALALAICVTGCGDGAETPAEDAPAPVEAEAVPTTRPLPREAVEVEAARVEVGGESYLLPPMRLGIGVTEQAMDLQLYASEDEGHATGNTLYLVMQVEGNDWSRLNETPWRFESPDEAWTDTPQGLTLGDGRWVLRPAEVLVRFTPDENTVSVHIQGTFLMWDITAAVDAPPRRVVVESNFVAAVVGG